MCFLQYVSLSSPYIVQKLDTPVSYLDTAPFFVP